MFTCRLAIPVALWVAIVAAPGVRAQDPGGPAATPPAPTPTPDGPPRLADVSDQERRTLDALLGSPHWAFRVFGLLRLERYEPASVETLVLAALTDPIWQVRCFAVRQAGVLGIRPSNEEMAGEQHPLVVRAILRHLGPLPAERIERGTLKLMRTRDVEDFILGCEMAAACDVEPLREEARRRIVHFIRNVDDLRAAIVARRLGRLLGLPAPPTTAEGWRHWLAAQGGAVTLPAPNQPGGNTPSGFVQTFMTGTSTVAGLEPHVFARLREYLDALKTRDLDVVIVMDCTASMLPMINEARVGTDELVLFLTDISRKARMGFVAYRDHDNPPVVESHRITDDVASIRRYLFGLNVTGGADYPEAVYDGLSAASELRWNREGERQVILVGDAPPHERDLERLTELLATARNAGTSVHAVHVPMRRDEAFYRNAPPDFVTADQQMVSRHNEDTLRAFTTIAELGGGRLASLTEAGELVPAIMHFWIAEPWWPVFDGFYRLYVELCR